MPRTLTYAQAIAEATAQAMELDARVFVIGQGVHSAGYIFGSVEGLSDRFGSSRVMEMPLSESAVGGICVGAALAGLRPLYILQRADFSFLTLDQVINHASKYFFMFGGQTPVPLTLRLIVGKGWGQGPQHSQHLHSLFAQFPGLRVVSPADAYTAKGMLLNSIFSNDPTIILEGRPLYGIAQEVPLEPYVVPFGKASILRAGTDVTILALSFCVPSALAAASALERTGIQAEVIDLVSVAPLDVATIVASARKTRHVIVVDPSWSFCGFAAEVAATISEQCFDALAAPVVRLTPPATPTPTAPALEAQYYPDDAAIVRRVRALLGDASV